MSSRSSSRPPAQQASQRLIAPRLVDQDALDQQLALAERRGADLVRAQIRDAVMEGRRIVRMGEHQIEVIEVAVLSDLLAADPD